MTAWKRVMSHAALVNNPPVWALYEYDNVQNVEKQNIDSKIRKS